MTQLSTTRYQKKALLGEGGMGRVSLALDTVTQREVALKEILAAGADATEFKQEFWWMTRLRHPNLVEVYDFGTDPAGRPFFTMELVAGESLDAQLPLSEDATREVLKQLCRVLRHIHQQGLVHLDLKPENIRLLADGSIKLMDFGLMSRAGHVATVRGTPAYMAPEVIHQARIDQRADLYSLGVIAYQLLTGRLPFERSSTAELLRAHLEETPLPLTRFQKELGAHWNPLVLRLLGKEPLKRFQSAAEVLEALGEEIHDEEGTLLCAPFVGRESELEVFAAAFGRLDTQRTGQRLAISGPEGAGKSRLLDEFALHAQLAQVPVVRGVASVVGAAPYGPFAQLLRQAWPELVRWVPATLEAHAPALHALVPELARQASAHRLEPQQEKLRLQTAFSELFYDLSTRTRLVLLLDNWDAADALSVELLAALERRLADRPVVLIVAGRDAGPSGYEPLPLAPLSRPELTAMLGAMLGVERVPYPFVNQFAELTGGVPLLVETFLGHLVENRLLARENGRWSLQPLPAEALPAGIHEVLGGRLDQLSALGRRVIELGAVIGAGFPLGLLERLLPDVAAEALYEEIAGLEAAQWLTHQHGAYQLAQGHMGEAVRHRLAPEALRALNTQIAEALEEADGEGERSDARVIRLAFHFLASDRPYKAILYALKAAQRTAALFANDQARDFLQRGLVILEAQPDASAALRVDFLSLLGTIHRRANEMSEAERCYDEAIALVETQDRPEVLAQLLVSLGILKQTQAQYDHALAIFQRALPITRELGDPSEELRGLATMGRTYYMAGDMPRSQAAYEEALARAREVGDLACAGESLSFLGWLHVSDEPRPGVPSRVAEGLRCLKEAIALKETVGDKRGLNDTFMLLGNAQLALGLLADARVSFARNQAICVEVGATDERIFSSLNLGLVATEQGEHLQALEHVQAALTLARASESAFTLGLGACLEARALLHLGQLQKPLQLLEDSLQQARETENRYWELFALVYLTEAQLKLGLYEGAQASLLDALEVEAATGITEYAHALQLYKAHSALKQGHHEPAESAYREALGRAEAKEAQSVEAKACLGLASVALATGDVEAAGRWALRARDRAEGAGAHGVLTEIHYLQGQIACRAGDKHEGDRHFQRAQESAEQLNLLDLLARSLHQRASLQFPATKANKLKARAQELMIQQVDGLAQPYQEAFLAAEGRYAVFNGELTPLAVETGLSPASDDVRQAMQQQQVWIEELQGACSLLMKQLDFSQVIARSTDATYVLGHALTLVLEVAQAERGEVLMLEGKRLVSRARKQASGLHRMDEDWTHYIDQIEGVIATGEPLYVASTADFPGRLGLEEPRSLLILPLSDDHQRIGAILALGHPAEGGALLKREVDAVKVLANQLSASLRNIRLQNEWREKTQRLEMLYMLSSSVTSTLVMEEVLDLVIKLSLEITQADRGFLFLVDDEGELECKAARHADGPIANFAVNEGFSQSICRRVLETGEPLCVEDTRDDESLKNQKSILDLNLRTVMCVPLKVKSKYLGVLYVDSRVVVNTFSDRDLEILKSIASHASIALENARLYKLATVDSLTGLYFRSHFEQRLKEELLKSQRYGSPLSYMMMDIDHFKKFNDTYGHAVGDQVLRHVAGIIKNGVRQEVDIPCRYGGEEMVVLLPETDAVGAAIFAERIRKAVDEALLDTEEHKGLHVTISIGVACYPHHANTGLALMEHADQALYASKRGGRNRVTVYDEGLEPVEKK